MFKYGICYSSKRVKKEYLPIDKDKIKDLKEKGIDFKEEVETLYLFFRYL